MEAPSRLGRQVVLGDGGDDLMPLRVPREGLGGGGEQMLPHDAPPSSMRRSGAWTRDEFFRATVRTWALGWPSGSRAASRERRHPDRRCLYGLSGVARERNRPGSSPVVTRRMR